MKAHENFHHLTTATDFLQHKPFAPPAVNFQSQPVQFNELDVVNKGQVFTPEAVVARMLGLRKNRGRTLEPSAGAGAFTRFLTDYVGIEKDGDVITDKNILNMDFFDYPLSQRFDTIIGNPPYVRHNDIEPDTRAKLSAEIFDKRTNLYLFFIDKCLRHLKPGGELIFITPREFINLTCARRLNEYIRQSGTITDFIDLGDEKIFAGACPNVAIWRFEKDNFSGKTADGRHFNCINGKITFSRNAGCLRLGDVFDVKVGAVSGADSIFTHKKGNAGFVCSYTRKTGAVKTMFFNINAPALSAHKQALLNRRIKKFDERNWYCWGRNHHISKRERIYVNAKTRMPDPFFTHSSGFYDGSVLALFPKDKHLNIARAIDALNATDWAEQGFVCDGRYLFTQRSLSNALINRSVFSDG